MALNFSELAQAFNRVVHNSAEAIRKWLDMTVAPPKDVTIEYYDQNGNLITETIPNYRKQLNTLLRNKKNLVFLDGGNVSTLQELEDFLNNVPLGGRGRATIVADIPINKRLQLLDGKMVDLIIDCDAGGKLTFQAFTDTDGTKKMGKIYLIGSSLNIFLRGNINYAPIVADASTSTASWTTDNLWKCIFFPDFDSWLRIALGAATLTSPYVIDLSSDPEIRLAVVAKSRFHSVQNIRLATTTQILLHLIGFTAADVTGRLLDSAGNDLYTDANGNPVSVKWRNHTTGLVFNLDANGNPIGVRNLVTSQDFINV